MNHNALTCPICESGNLQVVQYSDEFDHNGKKILVDNLEKCECGQCGSDPILKDQIKHNHLLVSNAKRNSDSLLTSDEIIKARAQLRLTQKEASILFGGGPNAFSKYERGDVIQSTPMDRLIRLCIALPHAYDWLVSFSGLNIKTKKYVFEIKKSEFSGGPNKLMYAEPIVYSCVLDTQNHIASNKEQLSDETESVAA